MAKLPDETLTIKELESMTIEQPSIPDAETRKREVEGLPESNRQLVLVTLALDESIAIVEADLRHQRRERLENKHGRVVSKVAD
jgi:hypothetical protein